MKRHSTMPAHPIRLLNGMFMSVTVMRQLIVVASTLCLVTFTFAKTQLDRNIARNRLDRNYYRYLMRTCRSTALATALLIKSFAVMVPSSSAETLESIVSISKVTSASIKSSNANDPRLYFLEIQDAILGSMLTNAYFGSHPKDREWLTRTTSRFMGSLHLALKGQFAVKTGVAQKDAALWVKVGAGELGGFWWGQAFADCKKLEVQFGNRPWPDPQLDEWYSAAFMIAHIEWDLRLALLLEGIGSDDAFNEVGKMVKSSWAAKSRHPRSMIDFALLIDPLVKQIDPLKRRTDMRTKVKAYLTSEGITNAYKGIVISGIPNGKCFEGAPGVILSSP